MAKRTELAAAVVGCGGAGTTHARGYRNADGAHLVGVCDLDADRAAAVAAEHDVPAFEHQGELHAQVEPDLVSIATPEAHHVGPAETALEAGAHVLCEKVMATAIAEGERLVATANRTDRILAVDYNYRHMPSVARLVGAIADGELGPVSMAVAETHAYAWHHALDLLVALLGPPRTVISAHLDHDESLLPERFQGLSDELLYVPSRAATAMFTFASGATASLSASLHTDLDHHLVDLSVYGEAGRASLRGTTPGDTTGRVEPGPLAQTLDDQPRLTLGDTLERSVQAVVDAVAAEERPPTTGADALSVMRMERAVVQAATNGGPVTVG